ncbi:hypothetical protein R6Q57_018175 [Mikania cordata]
MLGTFDYSCSKASPPVQEKDNRGNESIFDGILHYVNGSIVEAEDVNRRLYSPTNAHAMKIADLVPKL